MSTIVNTPFGTYETYNGKIWEMSEELREFLGGGEIKDPEELQRILARRVREVRNSAEQNKARLEKQMAELKRHADEAARRAAREAKQQAEQRIAEAKRTMQERVERTENEMASRISHLNENTRRNLESLRREQQNALRNLENRVYDDMHNMHRPLDSRIEGLAHDMSVIQGDLLNRVARVQSNVDLTNARLDATNEHLDMVETSLLGLTDYVDQMERQINQRFSEQEEEIQHIHGQVEEIQHRMAAIDAQGIERANMARALMTEVEHNNDLNRFVHEEAQRVRRQMQGLGSMGDTGAVLSAAANAAIIAAQELEINCTRERLKYEQKEELTRAMLEAVLKTVNDLRQIPLTDDNGNAVSIENNWWSRGRYNTVKDHLQSLKTEIENKSATDMTIERLDEIQKEILKGEVDIREITSQSVARVNFSQARMQAVSDIVGVMEEQAWEVIEKNGEEEIGYIGGEVPEDFREGFFARMKNALGEEVTVMVDPNDDDTNTLGFHFSSPERVLTDEETEEKASIVATQIARSGYEVGTPKCASHSPMPEMESREEMGRVGAAERIRQRGHQ